MSEEQNQEDIEISEYEELLYTPFSDFRIFHFLQSPPILGILLQETDDSFLVGLATKLVKQPDSDTLKMEEVLPFPYLRLFKSNVFYVTPQFNVFEYAYLKYLKEVGLVEHPEMIDFLPDNFLEEGDLGEGYQEQELPLDEELEEKLVLAASKAGISPTTRTIH